MGEPFILTALRIFLQSNLLRVVDVLRDLGLSLPILKTAVLTCSKPTLRRGYTKHLLCDMPKSNVRIFCYLGVTPLLPNMLTPLRHYSCSPVQAHNFCHPPHTPNWLRSSNRPSPFPYIVYLFCVSSSTSHCSPPPHNRSGRN